jgi:hypothetical protein
MRFYDEIMRSHFTPAAIRNLLSGSIIIIGDNVAEYYFEGTDKEEWLPSDFPNAAPPWDEFWIDFKAPRRCVSEKTGITAWGQYFPSYWGVYCRTFLAEDANELTQTHAGRERLKERVKNYATELWTSLVQEQPNIYKIAEASQEQAQAALSPEHFARLNQAVSLVELHKMMEAGEWQEATRIWNSAAGIYKWVLDVIAFQKVRLLPGLIHGPIAEYYRSIGQPKREYAGDEIIMGPIWKWQVYITSDGQVAKDPQDQDTYLIVSTPEGEMEYILADTQYKGMSFEDASEVAALSISPILHTALLTISFLHCHNVSLEEVRPPKLTVHNKSAKRRGERDYQPVTYKILDIHPMREVLRQAEQDAPQGEKTQRSLHICRGHFRHYEEGRGLFGKYHGTFWIPLHVRGQMRAGIAVKDYRMKLDEMKV